MKERKTFLHTRGHERLLKAMISGRVASGSELQPGEA